MKAFRVDGQSNPALGKNATCCGRKIKLGQVIVAVNNSEAPYGARTQYLHKGCVERALDKAPAEASERDFDLLRTTILETGHAFPAKV